MILDTIKQLCQERLNSLLMRLPESGREDCEEKIFWNVSCEECEQCGEKYFSDEVMEQLDCIIDKAQMLASEIFITDYTHRAA